MAIVTTDNAHYGDIAAAIREKVGGTAHYKPAEMAAAIRAIQTGGGASQIDSLIDRTIKEISSNSVKSISEYSFYNCYSLAAANFPVATNIGNYAFYGCRNLITVNFPAATRIQDCSFEACSGLETVNFPAVTFIGSYSFRFCSKLTTVDFHNVTSISAFSFIFCSKLTAIILRSETMAKLSNTNAFDSTPIKSGTGYIYVPAALVDSYKTATNWSVYANQIRAIEDYPDITGGAA